MKITDLTTIKQRNVKAVNFAGDSSYSEIKAEIGLAEWTKKKEPVSCPFAKKG